MASERSVGVVWSEETENGVVLHMRVGTGADVMLTLPNADVLRHKRKRNFARFLPWRQCSFSGSRKRPRLAARCGRASCQRRPRRTLRSRPRLL